MKTAAAACLSLFLVADVTSAANLSGQWKRRYDKTVDGVVSGTVGEDTIELVKKGGKYVGGYVEAAHKHPARIYTATVSRRIRHHVVVFHYDDGAKANYHAVIAALLKSDGEMVGTWYDSRGNAGDVVLTRVQGGAQAQPSDSAVTPSDTGVDVTLYWHMADNADVYLNGTPLRKYEPSFKTRPDEAPQPAFSAQAHISNGDMITVGGRRGGSYGLMLVAVDSAGKVVFKTDDHSWQVYHPGENPQWYTPTVARASKKTPVTVQTDPWYPQKDLNGKYGNQALSIWGTPSDRIAYLLGEVTLTR